MAVIADLAHSLTPASKKGSVCRGFAATGLVKTILLPYGTPLSPDSLRKSHDAHETAEIVEKPRKPRKRGSYIRRFFRGSRPILPLLAPERLVGCVPCPLFGGIVGASPFLFSERIQNGARICLARGDYEALFAMALHEPWILFFRS